MVRKDMGAETRTHRRRSVTGRHARASSTLDDLFGKFPTAEDSLRWGNVEKRIVSATVSWQKRQMALTRDFIMLTNVGSEKIMDHVPLTDVLRVERKTYDESVPDPKTRTIAKSKSFKRDMHNAQLMEAPNAHIFEFQTQANSICAGRTYCFRTNTEAEAEAWCKDLKHWIKVATDQADRQSRSRFVKIRDRLRNVYESAYFQAIMAAVITGNFIVNVIGAELLPEPGSTNFHLFEDLDLAFTLVFAAELLLNVFVNWYAAFITGWNLFDTVIVLLSLVSLLRDELARISVLRLMRVFRIIRLFKRLESLRTIVNSLTTAILPVLNAMMVLAIVTSIYAVMAVILFKDASEESFGRFSASLFTMFQVCTGDGWATEIVRPMMRKEDEGGAQYILMVVFFVSYILIVAFVLLNIVVAVMLDEFFTQVAKEKERRLEKEIQEMEDELADHPTGPLDPLLAQLTYFDTSHDLAKRIEGIFKIMDDNDTGALDYTRMREGLARLRCTPAIHLTAEDWAVLSNGRDALTFEDFERMVRRQLMPYVQRRIGTLMIEADAEDSHLSGVLFVLKVLTVSVNELEKYLAKADHSRWNDATDNNSVDGSASHAHRRRSSNLNPHRNSLDASLNHQRGSLGLEISVTNRADASVDFAAESAIPIHLQRPYSSKSDALTAVPSSPRPSDRSPSLEKGESLVWRKRQLALANAASQQALPHVLTEASDQSTTSIDRKSVV